MTVIAWDGATLAADKQGTQSGYALTVSKLRRLPDGSIGAGSGEPEMINEMFEWIAAGADPVKLPAFQRIEADTQNLYLVRPDGKLYRYGRSPYPVCIEDRFYSAGSGRDFALAAMYLGHDARKAVEVAIALDTGCGNGVDAMELDAPEPQRENRMMNSKEPS